MTRIANTKIVHEDGGVQWILEREVGDTTYFENVYFTPQMMMHREYCALKLRKARRDMRLRLTPKITWQTQMLMRGIMSEKEVVVRYAP